MELCWTVRRITVSATLLVALNITEFHLDTRLRPAHRRPLTHGGYTICPTPSLRSREFITALKESEYDSGYLDDGVLLKVTTAYWTFKGSENDEVAAA